MTSSWRNCSKTSFGARLPLVSRSLCCSLLLLTLTLTFTLMSLRAVDSQQSAYATNSSQQQPVELIDSYPYYMQSPLVAATAGVGQHSDHHQQMIANTINSNLQQRSTVPSSPKPQAAPQPTAPATSQRLISTNYQYEPTLASAPIPPPTPIVSAPPAQAGCLYDKRHFLKLDQCLERKPYPTIGLPAFKNDDLLIKRGLSDKRGCSFILTNGLFKSFLVQKFSLDSDTQCLDQDKSTQLSMQFSNVSLYYMWQLRCLNYANQLLDDSTLASKTMPDGANDEPGSKQAGVCVGSSQNFGFTSLQLTNIEAQIGLSVDIYKNWRVTNVTLAMMPHGKSNPASDQQQLADSYHDQLHPHPQHSSAQDRATSIKDFTFDSLDGDELNWRYLHLYENWSRNRLHVNFLDQFKRFLWISLQRCLSESSEKLPVRPVDMFGPHKYS